MQHLPSSTDVEVARKKQSSFPLRSGSRGFSLCHCQVDAVKILSPEGVAVLSKIQSRFFSDFLFPEHLRLGIAMAIQPRFIVAAL
jgi:hypothetical protein